MRRRKPHVGGRKALPKQNSLIKNVVVEHDYTLKGPQSRLRSSPRTNCCRCASLHAVSTQHPFVCLLRSIQWGQTGADRRDRQGHMELWKRLRHSKPSFLGTPTVELRWSSRSFGVLPDEMFRELVLNNCLFIRSVRDQVKWQGSGATRGYWCKHTAALCYKLIEVCETKTLMYGMAVFFFVLYNLYYTCIIHV